MPHTGLLLIGVAVMSCCGAAFIDCPEAWPDEVPSRAYYERVWESDSRLQQLQPREQYLAGVLRFYSGSSFVTGWKQRRAQIAVQLSPEQARLLEPDLELLGQLISSEWSKPDPVRRISSKTLALWGTAMTKACELDQMAPLLEQIRDDVRSLLQGDLEPAAVTADRYPALALTQEQPR